MQKILGYLLTPPVPHILGLVLLSVVIWFGGRALESWLGLSDSALLLIIGGVWLLAGLVWVWRRYQASKRARLIEDRLRGQAREHKEAARPDRRKDIEALEQQLSGALDALKTSKMGKSALYSLPWYVIIGPPGSGKTTLLRESGLNFPELSHGRGVRGVGGTRNCDWWFTDSGILLDTAGRYTTESEDRDEWLAFLDMIKKARSKKPINGAVIAISIADIVQAGDEQLADHCRKIKERIAELTDKLELVFPVYLLFTKCDLLDGFVEFFGSYTKQERSQVWGFTLPYLEKDPQPLGQRFRTEFDELHTRLSAQRLQHLGKAKSKTKQRKVFSFPLQFQLTRDKVAAFVEQLVQDNPYHESSDVRGFYFTSGTQEGQPLDQILASMRSASGLEAADEPEVSQPEVSQVEVSKKAYFIDELFQDIVFPDHDLARSSAKAEKRRELIRKAAMIGSVAATFIVMVLLFVAYAGHSSLIDRSMRVYTEASAFDPKDPEHLRREEQRAGDGGGPFEQLRVLFEELRADFNTIDSYLIGQTNNLYTRRIRPLYVEKVLTTFVEPIQNKLETQLKQAIELGKRGEFTRAMAKETDHRLTGYKMLGGLQRFDREFLGEDFLVRDRRWTWRPGEEVPACFEHLTTYVQFVIGTTFKDWAYINDRSLIPEAAELVNAEDILGQRLKEVVLEQGQGEQVPLTELIGPTPATSLLAPTGVQRAWVDGGPSEEALEKKGELIGGDEGAEAMKTRARQEAINTWKGVLATMKPDPKPNVRDAMRDLIELTGENNPYIGTYTLACSKLRALKLECEPGDLTWFENTLAEIAKLEEVTKTLYESGPHLRRIVPAAQKGAAGPIEQIRVEYFRVRSNIEENVRAYAAEPLRDSTQIALTHLVDSLQYAIAREIEQEVNQVWDGGIGKDLREFSQQFPFKSEAEANASTADFNAIFSKGGRFDEAWVWIDYLATTARDFGYARLADEFQADREFVARIQEALFTTGDVAERDIEFLAQKRGNMSAVRFAIGTGNSKQEIIAKGTENPTWTWTPAMGAVVEVQGVPAFGKRPSSLEERSSWGLVRLLAKAEATTRTARQNEYHMFRWTTFRHPESGQVISVDGKPVEAAVLLRTESEPNPLAPGFFHHEFSREVFVATEN